MNRTSVRMIPGLVAGALAAGATVATSAETRDLIMTRTLEAPVADVWKAWTESESVMAWWGPAGFTAPLARMDVREGGTSIVCMRPPEGPDLCNSWTYSLIVPNQRLEFVLDWADKDGNPIDPSSLGLPPEMPRHVRHVITFVPLGSDRTELTVTEYGYTSEMFFDLSKAGLSQTLDKLEAYLASE